MLHPKSKPLLTQGKNLLAFSAGVDSTALFFLLRDAHIPFDIALVDYGIREQSKQEVAYAKELAQNFQCKCHIFTAPRITRNFEAQARTIRYNFFEELIAQYNYTNLLTAHHLGDRFEWMLMQFCKGAGCIEIAGMQMIQTRNNYTLIRPLLYQDKSDLLEYLHKNNIQYFEDDSNNDLSITRNKFRHNYARTLLDEYKEGIAKSFSYLDKDIQELVVDTSVQQYKDLGYFKATPSMRSNIIAIDQYLKARNHIITASEKLLLEDLYSNKSSVLGRKYLVSYHKPYIFITPFKTKTPLPKVFKEKMRKLQIDPKLRVYLYLDAEVEAFVSGLLA